MMNDELKTRQPLFFFLSLIIHHSALYSAFTIPNVASFRIPTQPVLQAATRPHNRAAAGGMPGALGGAVVFRRVRIGGLGRVGVGDRSGRIDGAIRLCNSPRVFVAQPLPDRSARTVHSHQRRHSHRSRVRLTPWRAPVRDGGPRLQRVHLGRSRAALEARFDFAVERLLAAYRSPLSTLHLWLPYR